MSEQIVLPGFSGDVVLVNGLCYEFAGYTIQPSEDLDIEAKFETCDECSFGVPEASSSSAFSSSGSAIPEPVRCNDCDPQLADTYNVAVSGLESPWNLWNGSTTVHWKDGIYGPGITECGWGAIEQPDGSAFGASVGLSWGLHYPDQWSVRVFAYTFTYIDWVGPTDPCDPRGSYGTHEYCNDNIGTELCDNQGATTCTVS